MLTKFCESKNVNPFLFVIDTRIEFNWEQTQKAQSALQLQSKKRNKSSSAVEKLRKKKLKSRKLNCPRSR